VVLVRSIRWRISPLSDIHYTTNMGRKIVCCHGFPQPPSRTVSDVSPQTDMRSLLHWLTAAVCVAALHGAHLAATPVAGLQTGVQALCTQHSSDCAGGIPQVSGSSYE
jgi:hypothetical protein